MATSERPFKGTLKDFICKNPRNIKESRVKGHLPHQGVLFFLILVKKKFDNKVIFFYFVVFTPRTTPDPKIGLWTFEPAFSQRS